MGKSKWGKLDIKCLQLFFKKILQLRYDIYISQISVNLLGPIFIGSLNYN